MRPLAAAALAALLAASACGGPPPPTDPPQLAGAKESLARGAHWFGRGCYREAERFFKDGEISARLSDEVRLIIRALNGQGAAALARGDLDWAADLLARALEASQAQADRPELDRILGNLAALALRLDRLDDAENLWLAAIQAAGEAGAPPAAYQASLARLYAAAGRREEFLTLADKTLASARAQGRTPQGRSPQGRTARNDREQPAEALREPGEAPALADALNLAGQAARERDRPAEAENFFREALELDRRLEYAPGLAQDAEALGRLSAAAGRLEEAAGFFDRAFYLRLALGDSARAGGLLAEMTDLAARLPSPLNLAAYKAALKNPAPWLPDERCP